MELSLALMSRRVSQFTQRYEVVLKQQEGPKGNFINHRYSALKHLWHSQDWAGGKHFQNCRRTDTSGAKSQCETSVYSQVVRWCLWGFSCKGWHHLNSNWQELLQLRCYQPWLQKWETAACLFLILIREGHTYLPWRTPSSSCILQFVIFNILF